MTDCARRATGACAVAALAGMIFSSVAASAQDRGQPGVRIDGERLSLSVSRMPFVDLLTVLSRDSGIEFTVHGDSSRIEVSSSFTDLELLRGLQRILSAQSHMLVDHRMIGSVRHIEIVLLGDDAQQPPLRIADIAPPDETSAAFEEPLDVLVARAVSSGLVAERAAAAEAAAYRKSEGASGGGADQLIVQFLADPDTELRGRAIAILKDTADRVPFTALAQLAREDSDPTLRMEALALLIERSENDEWRESLRIALNDADPTVRERARDLALDWHLDPAQ